MLTHNNSIIINDKKYLKISKLLEAETPALELFDPRLHEFDPADVLFVIYKLLEDRLMRTSHK